MKNKLESKSKIFLKTFLLTRHLTGEIPFEIVSLQPAGATPYSGSGIEQESNLHFLALEIESAFQFMLPPSQFRIKNKNSFILTLCHKKISSRPEIFLI